jgi:hypothetical protein
MPLEFGLRAVRHKSGARVSILRGMAYTSAQREATMAGRAPGLRFAAGDRIECNMGSVYRPVWAMGTVTQLWHQDDAWPKDKWAPYQVRLDSGNLIFAPTDADSVCRAPPADGVPPAGRACGCGSATSRMATYRDLDGESTFTGIAQVGDQSYKLDDPNGELDGPGHAMDQDEWISESKCSTFSPQASCAVALRASV